MSNEIANQYIENAAKNVKSSQEAIEVVKGKERIIKSHMYSISWLFYQQVQIFERFKLNHNFMNMVNQFGISDVINTINEIIVALKQMRRERLFRPLQTKIKISIKDFLVNLIKSIFYCVFTEEIVYRKLHFCVEDFLSLFFYFIFPSSESILYVHLLSSYTSPKNCYDLQKNNSILLKHLKLYLESEKSHFYPKNLLKSLEKQFYPASQF